jgi:predicted  nucleic acid-binding Zn-ribbon protein
MDTVTLTLTFENTNKLKEYLSSIGATPNTEVITKLQTENSRLAKDAQTARTANVSLQNDITALQLQVSNLTAGKSTAENNLVDTKKEDQKRIEELEFTINKLKSTNQALSEAAKTPDISLIIQGRKDAIDFMNAKFKTTNIPHWSDYTTLLLSDKKLANILEEC